MLQTKYPYFKTNEENLHALGTCEERREMTPIMCDVIRLMSWWPRASIPAVARKAGDEMKIKSRDPIEEGEVSAAAEASPPPTEEEVEEFFAIVRRMRVAVKYFENEASNNNSGSKIGATEPQSSTSSAAAADGGKSAVAKLGLDLNAEPEAESSLI
ncbi:hypothetical protein SASPL_138683 [Salvia splendens]|uniref:Uncharacterized protein n=1 Tax=Salvia splendens TaxID=180675 RepID=A0A8X8ZED6_SALSN|nr:hypothetical protein SASPL_138683 [Salvia splendens]